MKKNKILLIVVAVILILFFIIFNIFLTDKNIKNNKTTKPTTTKSLSSDYVFTDEVYIEGIKEEVSVKKYKTYFGYTFNYMTEYFKVAASTNNTYIISSLYDENNYIKIEVIDEHDFYRESSKLKSEKKNGYLYEYTFLKNKNVFLKVTKVLPNKPEYMEGLNVRMNYTINSIEI